MPASNARIGPSSRHTQLSPRAHAGVEREQPLAVTSLGSLATRNRLVGEAAKLDIVNYLTCLLDSSQSTLVE